MPLKPKSGKRGAKPASFDQNFTGTEKDLSDYIKASAKYFMFEQPKDDNEALERISDMFQDCAENNSVPTVEKLALCLGTTVQTMNDWVYKEYKGHERAVIIKRAKQVIASIDAEAVLNGKLNTICYLFRAKNFYSMSDNVVVEHKATLTTGEIQDQSMLVGALLKQLQGQTATDVPSDYQAQPSAIETAAEDFLKAARQATAESTEPGATIASTPAEEPSDCPTVEAEIVSDYSTRQEPSDDYEAGLPSDYAEEVRATISPLSALGKALAEETPSDYCEKPSDYHKNAEIIDLPAEE